MHSESLDKIRRYDEIRLRHDVAVLQQVIDRYKAVERNESAVTLIAHDTLKNAGRYKFIRSNVCLLIPRISFATDAEYDAYIDRAMVKPSFGSGLVIHEASAPWSGSAPLS